MAGAQEAYRGDSLPTGLHDAMFFEASAVGVSRFAYSLFAAVVVATWDLDPARLAKTTLSTPPVKEPA